MLEYGFAPNEGNFVPHITLGRVKHVVDNRRYQENFKRCQPTIAQQIPVTEVILYQSFLHKDGPEYKVLAKFPLARAGMGE